MNLRPSGYEPDELPDCSTPRQRVRSRHWRTEDGPGDGLAWQRPALPRLKTQYHRRCGLSLPSSGWDRVSHPRHNRQANASSGCVLSLPQIAVSSPAAPALFAGADLEPFERLGPVRFAHYCASTPGLWTWWSSTTLKRDLVLRGVSRLDAFSGYLVRP